MGCQWCARWASFHPGPPALPVPLRLTCLFLVMFSMTWCRYLTQAQLRLPLGMAKRGKKLSGSPASPEALLSFWFMTLAHELAHNGCSVSFKGWPSPSLAFTLRLCVRVPMRERVRERSNVHACAYECSPACACAACACV